MEPEWEHSPGYGGCSRSTRWGSCALEQPALAAPRWAGQQESSTFACRFTRYPQSGNKHQTNMGSRSLRLFSLLLLHFPSPVLVPFLFSHPHFYDLLLSRTFFFLYVLLHMSSQAVLFSFMCFFLFFSPFLLIPFFFFYLLVLFLLLFLCACSPSLYCLLLQLQTSSGKPFRIHARLDVHTLGQWPKPVTNKSQRLPQVW